MAKTKNSAAKKATKAAGAKKKAVKKAVKKTSSKKMTPAKAATKSKAAPKKAAKKAAKKGKRKPETLMCFLTTACVDHYGLPDNGYELNTLRHYRDTYLAGSTSGRKLVKEYYAIAPQIVQLVNQDKKKERVYEYIYSEITSACSKIEAQQFRAARTIYTGMVKTLQERYGLN